MDKVCEKVCVFEESLEIDFDYEFDVAKFFDFLRPESIDDVVESERWFYLAQGHPPSPLLLKFGSVTEGEMGGSDTSSSKNGHQNADSVTSEDGEFDLSSLDQVKNGPELLKSKSANQSPLSKSSRLLQPTVSQLAKQNQQISLHETRACGRIQKLGSSLKSPGDIAATKRQKLEYGYLRKVGQLKRQASFSHKLPKQVSSASSCHARPKVTVPKEPRLETANRAHQHRSRNTTEPSRDSKYDGRFIRMRPLNNRKTTELKKNTPSLPPETKGSKKSVPCSLKENKNPNTGVRKPTRCCLKQSKIGGGRMAIMAC